MKSFTDFVNKYKKEKLPTWIDLRTSNGCPAIINKQNTNISSIISVSNAIRFLLRKRNDDFQPSILYMYYFSRLLSNNLNQNVKVNYVDIFNSINTYGICSEKDYKYDINKINDKPEIIGSNKYEIEFHEVKKNVDDIKKILIDGKPVLMSCQIFRQFTSNEASDSGKIKLPHLCEKNIGVLECCIYGYRDSNKAFICMSNLGTNIGEKGFFYFPFDYVKKYSYQLYSINLK